MAICNLFNSLTNASGNFMLFSQYVEDITHSYPEGDNWKVVPTSFVALNVDYSKIDRDIVLNSGKDDLNVGVPKYFQNCFENACAYAKSECANAEDKEKYNNNYEAWVDKALGTAKSWTPEVARNLFWNCMFDGKFISTELYGSETSTVKRIPEVVYYGDIDMHSYNEHQGMGYGEIYCYIPSDAGKMNCQVVSITDTDINGRLCDMSNNSIYLVGTDTLVEDYPQAYYYNRDFSMAFDDAEISKLQNSNDVKYKINTIVVLYSIFRKLNDEWIPMYSNLPMGMYITGRFEDGKLSNEVTKHVHTTYGSGTSYGLRICTRFTSTAGGALLTNTDITTDDSGYTNLCQLMSAMGENLAKMLEISGAAHDTTQSYKETLAAIKNNRTNVPYVKEVNGVDCWFVNGRFVSSVNQGVQLTCGVLSPETVEKRLENLKDNDPTNDWSYIEDPNGCDCNPIGNKELAAQLGLDPDEYPDFGGGSTGSTNPDGCGCNIIFAEDEDVINAMNR